MGPGETELSEVPLQDAERKGSVVVELTSRSIAAGVVKDEEDDNNDDVSETKSLLPEGFSLVDLDKDIYSLIFTGDLCGPGFWFGLFVALFQGTIVWLVLFDLIDWGDVNDNPLQIPAGNEVAVTVAQAFLMILVSQDSMDMMEGLEFLIDGYHPEVLNLCPHAKIWKWVLAGTAHLVVGMLLVVVIFILLMQETTVFGLGVDFVAMNKFFALIDNKAFTIARRGVFSQPLREEIINVDKIKIRKNTTYTWRRRARDSALIAVLLAGYGVLTYQQQHGKFLCDDLCVQFGDVFNPGIVEISGMFDRLGLDRNHDRRAVYQERSTGEFMLAYCWNLKRWTMTPYLDGIFEPCGSSEVQILARSGVDEGYDILTTADSWMVEAVRHGSGPNPFTHLYMACNECSSSCNTAGGSCDDNSNCVCQEGYYGLNCEFAEPCPQMTVSLRTESFPPFLSDYPVPNDFVMLTHEDGNNRTRAIDQHEGTLQNEFRPIYFGEGSNANWVLTFLGRRWIIYGLDSNVTKALVVAVFSNANYSAVDSIFSPIFVSSPMDINTPSDGPTPADLSWFYATRKYQGNVIESGTAILDDDTPRSYATTWWVEENQPLSTRLICAMCDTSKNPCKNFGSCNETTRTCSCVKEIGALCEYEVKCTDRGNDGDPDSIIGCPFNATCGASGKCSGCPDGTEGNTCQLEEGEELEAT